MVEEAIEATPERNSWITRCQRRDDSKKETISSESVHV